MTNIVARKFINLTFQLIDKIPENSHPENQSWCGIKRCGEIVLLEPKSILLGDGIQVFESDKPSKASDPEVVV